MLDPAIPDKRWWSREDIFLLVLLGALFFLPGISRIPLFDRDEPRFATAAREMAHSGDFLVPHFNGDLRPDKPPMVYWLMNLSAFFVDRAEGSLELAARLPSAVCSTLTLIVIYLMVGARFGRVTGLVSALIYGSCACFVVESRLATADAAMLFFTSICMACVWQAWDASAARRAGIPRSDFLIDRSRSGPDSEKPHIVLDHLAPPPQKMPASLALLFWVALAAATLTKGVPLLFVFVPMLTLSLATGTFPNRFSRTRGPTAPHRGHWNWFRQLRPLWGLPLFLALVGAWAVPAWYATEPHGALITQMVGTHFLDRVAGPLLHALNIELPQQPAAPNHDPMRTYAQPPGFYLLTVWATFWPWSILIVPAAYHAIRRMRGKTAIAIDSSPYQFLIAWIVPMWILLELSRGKLFHYPLPLFIALAILCADALVQSWQRLTDVLAAPWFAAMRWITLAIWSAMGIGALVAAHAWLDPDTFWRTIPFAGALIATGVASALAWARPSWPFVLVLTWAGTLLVADSLILPEFTDLQVSRIAAQKALALQNATPEARMAAVGYTEGSLVFYCRQYDRGQTLTLLQDPTSLLNSSDKWILIVDESARENIRKSNLPFFDAPGINQFNGRNSATLKPVHLYLMTTYPWRPPSTTAPASLP